MSASLYSRVISMMFALSILFRIADGHAAPFDPSFFGFNVTAQSSGYDNRMVAPLQNYTFAKWWFHNHLAYPPHKEDVFELPAGGNAPIEIACTKGATSFYASDPGGDVQDGNNPCPGSPSTAYHTLNESDAAGCAFAIAYKNAVSEVEPEDFTIFSTIKQCVWTRFNTIEVPAKMPPCPNGMCICSFFWIHNADAGSAQIYMNGFQCNVTNSTSNIPVSTAKVPRFCGSDLRYGTTEAHPDNCTYGAKAPFYWMQQERNNIFQDPMQPPVYNERYNFQGGAEDDIFDDSMLPVYVDGTVASYTMQGTVSGATATSIPASLYSASTSSVMQASKTTSVAGVKGSNTSSGHVASAAPVPNSNDSSGGNSSKVCRRKRSVDTSSASDLRRDMRKHRSAVFHKIKNKVF